MSWHLFNANGFVLSLTKAELPYLSITNNHTSDRDAAILGAGEAVACGPRCTMGPKGPSADEEDNRIIDDLWWGWGLL